MTKLIQICASENDLFGLDGNGVVYQFNFKTNEWLKLGGGQRTPNALRDLGKSS
jgi:hypothetical protein